MSEQLREQIDAHKETLDSRWKSWSKAKKESPLLDVILVQQKEILEVLRSNTSPLDTGQMRLFSAQLEATADLNTEDHFYTMLLSRLEFEDMPYRYEKICEAYQSTFEWVFKEPDDPNARWDNFMDWLSASEKESIYWVTGKAGSGKSTLMKFIFGHDRTLQALQSWSRDMPFLKAGFFFWNSGTEMQMSQSGLLRTLLYQLFSSKPSLMKELLEKRWVSYQAYREGLHPFSWLELKPALELLSLRDDLRLALFIDGLDEFDGDHKELTEFVLKLSGPNVRICAASRPWLVFEDEFKNKPNLVLEQVTCKDIRVYVTNAFESNQHFAKLQQKNEHEASILINSVVYKASGVFLWVYLVVRSLLQGMANADRMSDLERRLNSLPADLEELFDRLLRSLEPFYFPHASQLIQILKAAPENPTLLEMSFADDEDMTAAVHAEIKTLTYSEELERSEILRRRLNSRCKGLIGVSESQVGRSQRKRVEFLHRTVKDFFEKPDVWASIVNATDDSFNAHKCWSNSFLMQLKAISSASGTTSHVVSRLVLDGITYAYKSGGGSDNWQTVYLDELRRTAGVIDARNANLATSRLPGYDSTGIDCFLELVLRHGIHSYVQCKLTDDAFSIPREELTSLLDTAIRTPCVPVSIVRRLLEKGADPNRCSSISAPVRNLEIANLLKQYTKARTLSFATPMKPKRKLWWLKSISRGSRPSPPSIQLSKAASLIRSTPVPASKPLSTGLGDIWGDESS